MNDLSWFKIFGGSKWRIVWHFFVVGVIPSGVNLYPGHVILFFASSHFCRFIARFSSFGRFRDLSISFSWSGSDLFSYQHIKVIFEFSGPGVLSIVFWNVAGMLVSPQNPLRNLYNLVAALPSMLKIQGSWIPSSNGIWLLTYSRSSFKKRKFPGIVIPSKIFIATKSTRWSMPCFCYLFLCIASLGFSNLRQFLCFLFIFYCNDHRTYEVFISAFVQFDFCFAATNCFSSVSTLSSRCRGTLLPLCWYGMKFLSLLIWQHEFGISPVASSGLDFYEIPIHKILFCISVGYGVYFLSFILFVCR